METPFFSIIIPASRDLNKLLIAVGSVQSQDFSDYELVIVLNNYENGFKDYVHKSIDSPKITIVDAGDISGVSQARNIGLEISKGEWICFVDSDDYLLPNALQGRFRCARSGHSSVYHSSTVYRSEVGDLGYTMSTEDSYQPIDFLLGCKLHLNGTIIERGVSERHRFNVDFQSGEDWIYLVEVLKSAGRSLSCQMTDSVYIQHQSSYIYKNYLDHEERLLVAQAEVCRQLVFLTSSEDLKNSLFSYEISVRCRQLVHLIFNSTVDQISDFYFRQQGFIDAFPVVGWNRLIRHYLMRRFFIPKSSEHLSSSHPILQIGIHTMRRLRSDAPIIADKFSQTMLSSP